LQALQSTESLSCGKHTAMSAHHAQETIVEVSKHCSLDCGPWQLLFLPHVVIDPREALRGAAQQMK
jgi:hypothetical protein